MQPSDLKDFKIKQLEDRIQKLENDEKDHHARVIEEQAREASEERRLGKMANIMILLTCIALAVTILGAIFRF